MSICRGEPANPFPDDPIYAERDALCAALKACLDRLYMVSDDSESLGFIESCKPVIAQAEAALNIEP